MEGQMTVGHAAFSDMIKELLSVANGYGGRVSQEIRKWLTDDWDITSDLRYGYNPRLEEPQGLGP